MKLRFFLYINLFILILSCSDKNEFIEPIIPELNIEIIDFTHNSVSVSYTLTSNIKSLKLLWNDENIVDIENNIGELELDQSINEISLHNLIAKQTYYFRLIGEANGEIYYSEIQEVSLLEAFTLLESRQILNDLYRNSSINEVLKINDGYLFFTRGFHLTVTKTNTNFDVMWSFDISSSSEDLFYSGVYPLNSGNEYLLFYNGISGSNQDPYKNSYRSDLKVYAYKFTLSGQQMWSRNYSTRIIDNYYVNSDDYHIVTSKYSENSKFMVKSDSTYYGNNDEYYRVFTFNNNGDNINEIKISLPNVTPRKTSFRQNGDWINYGTEDETIMIERFTSDNQLIYHYNYGIQSENNRLTSVLEEQDNITFLGVKEFSNFFHTAGDKRWLFTIDEMSGKILYEWEESQNNFKFRPKDLIRDNDGSLLSLYFDMYNVQYEGGNCCVSTHDYNYATLIKSNQNGIIWKFHDGEENNTDNFEPERVFQDSSNEYNIIGRKNGLWLKKIKIK